MSRGIDVAGERIAWLADVSPDAWRLARLASIAVRIEPNLLRQLRLELLREADVGVEADFWFSPVVESQALDAVVLDAAVAARLRADLASDRETLEKAIGILHEAHAHLAPALRLEERINALALLDGEAAIDAIDAELRAALRAFTSSPEQAGEIGRWVLRAWPRLHEVARRAPAAATLALASATLLRRRASPDALQTKARLRDIEWVLPDVSSAPGVDVGVEYADDHVRFVEPIDNATITVPDTKPPIVEIVWQSDGQENVRVVDAVAGRSVRVGSNANGIRITTLAGEVYALESAPLEQASGEDDASLPPRLTAEMGLPEWAASCVGEVHALGGNIHPASCTAFSSDRVVSSAGTFASVQFVDIGHDGTTTQARNLNPAAASPLRVFELFGGSGFDGPYPNLLTAPSGRRALRKGRSSGMAWPQVDGTAYVVGIVDGVIRVVTGTAKRTTTNADSFEVELEVPMMPATMIGGPVIIDDEFAGILVASEQTGSSSGFLTVSTARAVAAAWQASPDAGETHVEAAQEQLAPEYGFARIAVIGFADAKSELVDAIAADDGQRIDARATLWWHDDGDYGKSGIPDGFPLRAFVLYESTSDERWPLALDLEHAALALVVLDATREGIGETADRLQTRIAAARPDLPIQFVVVHPEGPRAADGALRELRSAVAAEFLKRPDMEGEPPAPIAASTRPGNEVGEIRSAILGGTPPARFRGVSLGAFQDARRRAIDRFARRGAMRGRTRDDDAASAEWYEPLAVLTGERVSNGITLRDPLFFEEVVLAIVEDAEGRMNGVPAARVRNIGERWSRFRSRWKQLESLEIGPLPIVSAVAAEMKRLGLATMTTAADEDVVVLSYLFETEFTPPTPSRAARVLHADWTGRGWDVFGALVTRFAWERGNVRAASWDPISARGVAALLNPDFYIIATERGSTSDLDVTIDASDRGRVDDSMIHWLRTALENVLAGNESLTVREEEPGSLA